MKEILTKLKSIGYDDFLTIKHFGSPNQLKFMEQSTKWLLTSLAEI